MNTFSRVTIFGALFFGAGTLGLVYGVFSSPYVTQQNVVIDQPVPFSHEHHVRGLGIDCRYCHTSVEKSSFAGLPPTETCMTCHSQIWNTTEMLKPVRDSLRDNKPLVWNRVHKLPDYAYFQHSIHIKKGVGCSSCHGRVDLMPLVRKAEPLTMEWCLDCHRNPEKHIRPRDEIFNMAWMEGADQATKGDELSKLYEVHKNRLTNCSTCHR